MRTVVVGWVIVAACAAWSEVASAQAAPQEQPPAAQPAPQPQPQQQQPPQQQQYAPPPQGYQPPPQPYGAPPQGYQPPPQGYGPPPQGYAPPPQGYGPPPQPYGVPPQGYAPQQPYAPGSLGGPPPGYHYERRPNLGLVIAGASQAGAMWLFTTVIGLTVGAERNPEAYRLAVPVAGPFLFINRTRNDDFEDLVDGFLVFDGVVQLGGAVLVLVGLVAGKRVIVPDAPPTTPTVTPVVGAGTFGMRLAF